MSEEACNSACWRAADILRAIGHDNLADQLVQIGTAETAATRWVLEFDEARLYGPFDTKDAAFEYGQALASADTRDHEYGVNQLHAPVLSGSRTEPSTRA